LSATEEQTLPITALITIASDYAQLCEHVADRISALVQAKPNAVLGLATGSTPLGVYQRLVRRFQNGEINFSDVTCFNLDEYYPLPSGSPHSYHAFMQANLFQHIDCRRWFVPDGRAGSSQQIAQSCREYEAQITEAGGIDLQLLGIGRTGHIGFNEPGSPPDSRTRLVSLASQTREDAAESFGGLTHVPHQAVSMGIGTILEARKIILMASGTAKAEIVQAAWVGSVTERLPASWVRTHPNACLYLDTDAASLI
jgi:glucosamine-6-phosphate deaminase